MDKEKKNVSVMGNANLISNEEEEVARYLKEKNLQHTNQISPPVIPQNTIYTKYIKRILDICISLPIFLVLLPFNVILGICTVLDVGFPIFYKQTRVGMGGKYFTIVKFRNMSNKTDGDGRLLPPSQRVTKFGKIMRKFSLDELLNLWSVLKGDMSIIGPRPLPVFIYERMSDRHKMRSNVRPGLECPRVIELDYEDTCKYQRSYENDIWYVEHVSFFQDLKMVVLLVKMVFNLKKRDNQAKGEGISYFVGYDEYGHALSMNKFRTVYEKWRKFDEICCTGYSNWNSHSNCDCYRTKETK